MKQPETSARSSQLFIASSLPAGARVASTPHNFLSLCEPVEADFCCAAVSVWEQHTQAAGSLLQLRVEETRRGRIRSSRSAGTLTQTAVVSVAHVALQLSGWLFTCEGLTAAAQKDHSAACWTGEGSAPSSHTLTRFQTLHWICSYFDDQLTALTTFLSKERPKLFDSSILTVVVSSFRSQMREQLQINRQTDSSLNISCFCPIDKVNISELWAKQNIWRHHLGHFSPFSRQFQTKSEISETTEDKVNVLIFSESCKVKEITL